jgi:cbb3-type cytochrome oxidase subunit 3
METYNAWMLWMQQHSVIAVTLAFLLIVAWAYWPSHKQAIEQRGTIPLNDDP